jgi:hypothetical protein
VSSRRRISQLFPGVQGGKSLDPGTKDEKKKSAGDTKYTMTFDDHLKEADVKQAVDVSGGTAGYKVLFTSSSVSFYQQDGRPASKCRTTM